MFIGQATACPGNFRMNSAMLLLNSRIRPSCIFINPLFWQVTKKFYLVRKLNFLSVYLPIYRGTYCYVNMLTL